MFEHMSEAEARAQILEQVAGYCDTFHKKAPYKEGDRIPLCIRVYDHDEMVNLVDSSLEFWLTSGRYTVEFEKKLAGYLGVKYCSLVNSGSSANLLAFMDDLSALGERRIKKAIDHHRSLRLSYHRGSGYSVRRRSCIRGCNHPSV